MKKTGSGKKRGKDFRSTLVQIWVEWIFRILRKTPKVEKRPTGSRRAHGKATK